MVAGSTAFTLTVDGSGITTSSGVDWNGAEHFDQATNATQAHLILTGY